MRANGRSTPRSREHGALLRAKHCGGGQAAGGEEQCTRAAGRAGTAGPTVAEEHAARALPTGAPGWLKPSSTHRGRQAVPYVVGMGKVGQVAHGAL